MKANSKQANTKNFQWLEH